MDAFVTPDVLGRRNVSNSSSISRIHDYVARSAQTAGAKTELQLTDRQKAFGQPEMNSSRQVCRAPRSNSSHRTIVLRDARPFTCRAPEAARAPAIACSLQRRRIVHGKSQLVITSAHHFSAMTYVGCIATMSSGKCREPDSLPSAICHRSILHSVDYTCRYHS